MLSMKMMMVMIMMTKTMLTVKMAILILKSVQKKEKTTNEKKFNLLNF